MEKSVEEEEDDDQGSGWLQVKKKHRNSSRFSLQGWVGALSGKHNTNPPHSQGASFGKNRNSQGKIRRDLPVQRQGITVAVSSGPDKVKEVHNLDKNVVCQDAEPATLHSMKCVEESVVRENLETDNDLNSCPKIKWGDLDEEDLTQHIKNTVRAEFRFGDFQNGGIINGKAEDSSGILSCTSPNAAFIGNKEAVISVGDSHALCRSSSFAFGEEDNCKEVKEVLLEDIKVENTSEEVSNYDGKVCNGGKACNEQMEDVDRPIVTVGLSVSAKTEKVSKCDGNVSNGGELCNDKMESVNKDPTTSVSLSVPAEIEKNELEREVTKPTIIHEVSISEKYDAPMIASEPDKTGDYIDADPSFEGSDNQQAAQSVVDLSVIEVRSGNDGDESVESKERFRQRLWCFLFENLNRAVDELYLLCELECDMEQMNEALLVLDEAAFDFNELKSRVEKFENVKGSTAEIVEVPPSTMRSDLRRPHAVSWEVRRMSTSPHKADILSSSLEAFRKIQQERAKMHAGGAAQKMEILFPSRDQIIIDDVDKYSGRTSAKLDSKEAVMKIRDHSEALDVPRDKFNRERRNSDSGRACKINLAQKGHLQSQNSSSGVNSSKIPHRERSVATSVIHKIKKEQMGSSSETERQIPKKEKVLTESNVDKLSKSMEHLKKQNAVSETDKDKKLGPSWKTMDAWKEKRNWEDILASPCRGSSRYSHSPGINRKSAERTRNLHVKLMSPEMKKKTASDWKKEADQKHARATRIRNELENEKIQKLQRSSEKLTRVNEWQAVRSMKLREGMHERHQRSESRHEAFLAQVAKRAGDETIKVNEVRFITSLNDENKKLILRQKLQDSELRRAEKLQVIKSKQKEDIAREEAVLERKKILAAEKLQRLAEIQRRKEEAQVKREEERKALSAVREAKAMENIRRKVIRAKAQQEEAELLAQKLAERLRESEQRRKFYLEQIRERASMDFRDQSSPFLRRSVNKDAQGRSNTPTGIGEEYEVNGTELDPLQTGNVALQQSLKRRIKKLRQKLMALKYEFSENPVVLENGGIGYKTAVGTARSKVGRWLQELQRFRQARKEGAAGIGLITAEMIKFLEGKEPELQAARQAGLVDFIASALPASHTSKPEAYQVTIYLLRLLKVVLSLPANRSYFIAQNLLPPIIPLLAATLENYIKIAASSNGSGSSNLLENKTSVGNLDSISEALDGFVWTVTTIIGHGSSEERQLQMQDGLLELVLAYQVIHRLRDLFALYDRPQVEGSPFPSSIHLSINLLAVLTSRSRDISSIAWEYSVMENRSELDVPLNISASLSEVPKVAQGIALFAGERDKESVFREENSNGVKIESSGTTNSNITDSSQNIPVDDSMKPLVPQKDEKGSVDDGAEPKTDNRSVLKPSVKFLLSAISETGLVCLPSLLTAVLLQANNRLSSDLAPHVLPSNFEEVATGVLKVLNNLALIDISFMQKMLARPDLKMEFFHLMGFLLTYCTSKWTAATDQVGLLLLESLLLLGYFSLFHPANQAVLRWGKSPTILHKVCDLPFVFFSDPELMPVLASTLVAACYGCDQNKGVVQQELSTDMLLSLLKSCRNSLPAVRFSSSPPDNHSTAFPNESNQAGADSKKNQPDVTPKTSRQNGRNSRFTCTKSGSLGNGNTNRYGKIRNQKDNKTLKPNEEISPKQCTSALEASSALMLHSRFSDGFIDRAELFFTAETTTLCDEV